MGPLDVQRQFDCADIDRFSDAYIDGEFEAPERSLLEGHLNACEACRVALRQLTSLRTMLRARVGCGPRAPEGLRGRLLERLNLEDSVEESAQASATPPPARVFSWDRASWSVLSGAAVAASFSLFYTLVVPQRSDRWVAGDAAEVHARALPLEISTQSLEKLLPLFEHHLGFQVQPPAFPGNHVLLQGGRLWHLGTHDAAYIQYGDPQHHGRLSLFIVDDPGVSFRFAGPPRRLAGTPQDVYVAHAQGRNVVMWRSNDIVYSLVSDLGEDETLSLLGNARQ